MDTGKHLSDYKIKKIIEAFSADISATKASILLKISRISINKYYNLFRTLIYEHQIEEKKKFYGVIELDENYLYAVVSLPSGIFQPYSGVKTSILLIDREIAKRTKDILFIDVKNDGFDLGAQRRAINKNDLPEAFKALKEFQNRHCEQSEAIQEAMNQYKTANLVPKKR